MVQLRTHKGLTPKRLKKIQAVELEVTRADFSDELITARDAGIDRWYQRGGIYFLEWTKEHYRRWSGEPLAWDEPYQEEYYLLMGNPWVERLIIEKPSQVGFTESLIALSAFLLSEVRIPLAMGFERENKLRDIVSPRIQPSFDHIQPILALRKARWEATRRKDIDFQQRKLTVAGTELTFFYTSTSTSKKDTRRASSALSSFTAWVILGDEVELWSEGSIDIATERQSACEMLTKPFRMGSTPGAEGGIIDSQVKASGHVFEWNVICPHCRHKQALDAFGCLLRPVEIPQDDGSIELMYVDITGRPLKWFSLDFLPDLLPVGMWLKLFLKPLRWLVRVPSPREIAIETAYIGCQQCEHELTTEAIEAGHFESAGNRLTDFCDRVIKNQIPVFTPVALRMPRLASKLFDPAERIRKLITSTDPGDQLQQGLGKAISIGGGKIALPKLLQCVGREKPAWCDDKPDLVCMGVDQGRAQHWSVVTEWYLGKEGDWKQQWAEAFVVVTSYGDLKGFTGVADRAAICKVNLIGMDGEPEVQLAAEFARQHPLAELPLKQVSDPYWVDMDGYREVKLLNPLMAQRLQRFLEESGCQLIDFRMVGTALLYRYQIKGFSVDAMRRLDDDLQASFYAGITLAPIMSISQPALADPSDFQVILMDQLHLKGEPYRESSRNVHGEDVPVWNIHRTFGLDSVRDRIYRNLMSLPLDTHYTPGDEYNLIYHLLTSDRRTDGTWKEIPGAPDHYFHALNFASLAVLIHGYASKTNNGWFFGSLDRS